MASDVDVLNQKHQQMFAHLVEAEQWERVLEFGPQILANDPEDWFVHYSMGLAALEVDDKLDRARLHAKAALRIEPEEEHSHLLMARIHRKANRLLLAKKSLLNALSCAPEDAEIWMLFGWNCLERGDSITARKAVAQARCYNPTDASIESLATAVEATVDDSERLDAFEQIEGYEEALRFEPENEAVMYNIGSVYLNELDDAKNAEEWFRKAAMIDPTDKDIQEGLIAAIRRRDPVLRILNFPWNWSKRGVRLAEKWHAKRRWLIIVLLPLLPFVATAAIIALSIWVVFCFGPAKLYEWLTLNETLKKAGGISGLNRGIHRLPFVLRLIVFLSIVPLFVMAVWWFFTSPNAKEYQDPIIGGSMIVATVIGLWWSAKRQKTE